MPSLKEQLNHWIEEEVKFLERGHIAKVQDDIAIQTIKMKKYMFLSRLKDQKFICCIKLSLIPVVPPERPTRASLRKQALILRIKIRKGLVQKVCKKTVTR